MTAPDNPVEQLTTRELEVLKLIATGLSTKEIARGLGIAFKTAACHRSHIIAKLDIHEVANLTRYAIRNGLVDAGRAAPRRDERTELFDRIRITEAKYRRAMEEYHSSLEERAHIGWDNPDGFVSTRRLRQAEHE